MSHVKPHRWNDAQAGHVADDERAAMERHAKTCVRCAQARDRVTRAAETFGAMRTQATPELAWDSVRARVHWAVSSERRAVQRTRGPGRLSFGLVLGFGSALAIALGIVTVSELQTTPAQMPDVARAAPTPAPAPPSTPAPVAPAALAGLVNRATADVMIGGIRTPDAFGRRLVVGDVIATGEGRIDVQFGAASAFQLAPHSKLELRRFDARMIELVLDGTVDVQVGPRATDQRFVVHAGARDVEVRGTQFRVSHDRASTTIACSHGLVAVRDGEPSASATPQSREVIVPGERGLTVLADLAVTEATVATLTTDELASLAATTPYALPLWTDAEALANSSAPLEVTASRGRGVDVRVDGIEHGPAPLRIRVLPGRHTIEAADSAGRFRRVGWVDVGTAAARVDVPVEVAPPTRRAEVGDIATRSKQLRTGIDRVRLERCFHQIKKAGLSVTSIDVELSVDAGGAIRVLNVDSDLPSTTSTCVRDVLVDVKFGPGAATTWRARVDL